MDDDGLTNAELLSTTDAQVWAKEFCCIFAKLHEGREEVDEGWMIGWFANAIETGRSAGLRALESRSEVLYTKADMEAACEVVLAGFRSKPMLDKMVDRFLLWPLPFSVCADPIATKQSEGRIGTNLLTAIEARQMLEHVLSPRAEPGAPYDPAKKVVEGKPTGPWKDEAPGPASAAPQPTPSQTGTPRTDDVEGYADNFDENVVPSTVARQLERELACAQENFHVTNQAYVKADAALSKAERELAEAKKRFERCNEERERQHTRADDAELTLSRAKRDAEWLETALRRIAIGYEGMEGIGLQSLSGTDCAEIAEAALAKREGEGKS